MDTHAEKRFLGIPYDWRRPTWERVKRGWWNPEDPHVLVPKVFGWGWSFNLHALARRIGLVGAG